MIKRFVDDNRSFYAYAHNHKVWVNCPKCGELGFVWREKIVDDYVTQCVCTKCMFRVNEIVKDTFVYTRYWHSIKTLQGYHGKVRVSVDEKCPCKEGKFRFEQEYANKSQMPNVIILKCSYCQQVKDFYVKSQNVRVEKAEYFALATDPFLDYDLYLCEPTKFGDIFAYTPFQLSQLKAYVSADLRENTVMYRGYFFKLPKWIKSAKNRDLVLKAIGKLEEKVERLNVKS